MTVTGYPGTVMSAVPRLCSAQQTISKKWVREVQKSNAVASGSQSEGNEPEYPDMKCYYCQKNGRMARLYPQTKPDMDEEPLRESWSGGSQSAPKATVRN